MARPCRARQPISACIEPASAAPIEASVNRLMPVIRIGRRPKRSDSGPQTSCDRPKPSSKEVRVSWACAMLPLRLRVRSGSEGR